MRVGKGQRRIDGLARTPNQDVGLREIVGQLTLARSDAEAR